MRALARRRPAGRRAGAHALRARPAALVRGDPDVGIDRDRRGRRGGRRGRPGVRPHPRRRARAPGPGRRAGAPRRAPRRTRAGRAALASRSAPTRPYYLWPGVESTETRPALPARADASTRGSRRTSTWTSTSSALAPDPGGWTAADPGRSRRGRRVGGAALGELGGSRCVRAARARHARDRPATTTGISAVCAYDVNRAGWIGPVAVRPDRLGRGAGVAPLLGALHRMRAGGRTRAEVGWVGPVVPYARIGATRRAGVLRPPQGARVNLLPVPRHLDLGDRTVAPTEPRVQRRSAAAFPAEGYTITIDDDGTVTDRRGRPGRRCSTPARRSRSSAVSTTGQLPVGEIRDWPDLPVRAVMLDIARDKVPTMATLLRARSTASRRGRSTRSSSTPSTPSRTGTTRWSGATRAR